MRALCPFPGVGAGHVRWSRRGGGACPLACGRGTCSSGPAVGRGTCLMVLEWAGWSGHEGQLCRIRPGQPVALGRQLLSAQLSAAGERAGRLERSREDWTLAATWSRSAGTGKPSLPGPAASAGRARGRLGSYMSRSGLAAAGAGGLLRVPRSGQAQPRDRVRTELDRPAGSWNQAPQWQVPRSDMRHARVVARLLTLGGEPGTVCCTDSRAVGAGHVRRARIGGAGCRRRGGHESVSSARCGGPRRPCRG